MVSLRVVCVHEEMADSWLAVRGCAVCVSEAYSALASLGLLDNIGSELVFQPCAMIVVAVSMMANGFMDRRVVNKTYSVS